LAASNARRRPTGNEAKVVLVPSGWLQKRQVEYTARRGVKNQCVGIEPRP
jgi:hypothetical protein